MSQKNLRVTVLMPVFNGAEYLKEAIESILGQTYRDFEFIIIDDGSGDRSLEIIKSFKDERIKTLINEKNLGMSASLNRGLEIARGEYIARMDSDDISLPQRLEKQVRFMDRNPKVGVCGTWLEFFGESTMILRFSSDSEQIKADLLFYLSIGHPTVILRREMFKRFNLSYDAEYEGEDYELWTRAIKHFNFSNIQEVLYKYRRHSAQRVDLHKNIIIAEMAKIHLKQLRDLGLEPTEEEIAIHNYIINKRILGSKALKGSLEFAKRTEKWFCKIIQANRKNKIYEGKALLNTLGTMWFGIWQEIPKEELSSEDIKIFFLGSPLSSGITFSDREGFVLEYLEDTAKDCL